MSERAHYQAVYPIGDTNPQDLPVRNLDQAVRFYQEHLGFTPSAREETPQPAATLTRDAISIRLAENGGDPEQASCYIAVDQVEAALAELQGRGLDLSPLRVDAMNDASYRVFFVRAPDGLCYCIGQRLPE